jgi:glycerate kinase
LIRSALSEGCTRILIGIGGSATNDGGTGMAAALGVRFLTADGTEIHAPAGKDLSRISVIDCTGLDPRLKQTEISVATDVTNPLCGEKGASLIYGPQKGATSETAKELDAWMKAYSSVLAKAVGTDYSKQPGAGAAGGVGAGLMAYCGAQLRSGAEAVFEIVDLENKIRNADLVISGEGRVDATSAQGKLLSVIGAMAGRNGKPAIAVTGQLGTGYEAVFDCGISAVIPITSGPCTLEQSMADAETLLEQTGLRIAQLLRLGGALGTC